MKLQSYKPLPRFGRRSPTSRNSCLVPDCSSLSLSVQVAKSTRIREKSISLQLI